MISKQGMYFSLKFSHEAIRLDDLSGKCKFIQPFSSMTEGLNKTDGPTDTSRLPTLGGRLGR